MINVGLIGCGRVSHLHMCAYKHIPSVNVAAVSDIQLDKAKIFAQRYGIKRAMKDYLNILEMENLDYVDICTPTLTHAEIACDAARYGHNILLEKPMARSTIECDKILKEAVKHKIKLCICHNQLFTPPVMHAKNLVNSGEFDLTYFRVSVRESAELIGAPSWILTPEQGGILWETGCHAAYLQLHFLKDIDEVFAMGNKIKHNVHDHFGALLHTSSNTLGIIEVSWLARKPEVIFELISSDDKRMQILDYDYLLETPQKPSKSFLKGFYLDQKMIMKKWIKMAVDSLRKRDLSRCLHHYILINKYMQCIRNGSDPPVKPEDGMKAVRLLECIEESLKTNKPIKMENTAH